MNENRKRLGRLTVGETGQKLEFVSVFVGRFAGDGRVHIAKTEIGTYSIVVKGKTGDGEVIEHQMHLVVILVLAALFYALWGGIFWW